jgi:hypothetical protein
LRDLYYTDKVHLDGPQTIGDIIQTLKFKKEVIELDYEILKESDVESVINRMNFDIFGSSLVKIPDPLFSTLQTSELNGIWTYNLGIPFPVTNKEKKLTK